jgi:hypothetical protein
MTFVNGWHCVLLSAVCDRKLKRKQDAITTRSGRHAQSTVLALQASDILLWDQTQICTQQRVAMTLVVLQFFDSEDAKERS